MKETGLAIIAAGFFVGAAVQFAGADIASSTGHGNGGGSLLSGLAYFIAGVFGLISYRQASKNKAGQQS